MHAIAAHMAPELATFGIQPVQEHAGGTAHGVTGNLQQPPANALPPAAASDAATAGSGLDSHATFAALDSGSAAVPATWTHAGARTAEAGYQDPALGWVAVRAQQDAAGVHATLLAGSQDAAQSLSSHMAGLNSYLAQHHTPVQTLSVSSSAGQETAFAMGQGGGQGTGHEPAQNYTAPQNGGAVESISQPSARQDETSVTERHAGGTYVSVVA